MVVKSKVDVIGSARRLLRVNSITKDSEIAQQIANPVIHFKFEIADFLKNPLLSKCRKLIENSKPIQVTPKVILKKFTIGVKITTKVPGSGIPFCTPVASIITS
ncbi:unannotated protein [freshwater metagenome]|uniref:Unannotated protein n=1 Tax=freshwater metagenome TaxID=449393 RepID=A0A6J6X0F3_9ZZZZ|nr:hypothetical protein [Actinomycetota bacterium]